MSYAQKKEISGNRTLAIILVVVIQFALGYAIVTGLAYNIIKKASENLKTFEVEETAAATGKAAATAQGHAQGASAADDAAAIGADGFAAAADPDGASRRIRRRLHPAGRAGAAAAAAAAAQGGIRAGPAATCARLFSSDDYPASAQSAGAEGSAQAQLTIGPDGRVVGCSLVRSTGNGALDSATCNILRRRAKFTPARDSSGNATTDTYTTPTIVWRLEG